MCLYLMWKTIGYGPPTPRDIRHFYTLRQSGHGGTYFLLSSAAENWIPEGVKDPGQVEISDDDKKKGFIWGFPTSNNNLFLQQMQVDFYCDRIKNPFSHKKRETGIPKMKCSPHEFLSLFNFLSTLTLWK